MSWNEYRQHGEATAKALQTQAAQQQRVLQQLMRNLQVAQRGIQMNNYQSPGNRYGNTQAQRAMQAQMAQQQRALAQKAAQKRMAGTAQRRR